MEINVLDGSTRCRKLWLFMVSKRGSYFWGLIESAGSFGSSFVVL